MATPAARGQTLFVVLLVVGLGLSWIQPLYPKQQFLQHAPMPLLIPALFWAARRRVFSNAGFVCLFLFLVLHVIGARYLYSFVPGGEALTWLELGGEASGRNQYDRLVHLAFGILMMPPLVEVLTRRLRPLTASLLAVLLIFAAGAVYEIFEWLLTVVADPVDAARYNGQQGDLFDAQKDMTLAFLGALLVLPLTWRISNRTLKESTA